MQDASGGSCTRTKSPTILSGNCEADTQSFREARPLPVRAQAIPDAELIVPVYPLGPVFVREINCRPQAAVAIEPSLRPPSPENGNIRGVGRRLWVVWRLKMAKREGGDWRRARESLLFAAFFVIPSNPLTKPGRNQNPMSTRIKSMTFLNFLPLFTH